MCPPHQASNRERQRMTRPRLRRALAACTCGWITRPPARAQPMSTLSSTSLTTPAPVLDILCPSFGFFSRSLPTTRSSSSSVSSAPSTSSSLYSVSEPRASLRSSSARPGQTYTRRLAKAAHCSCSLPVSSCVRCKFASSLAGARTKGHISSDDRPHDSVEDLLRWSLSHNVWAPPPEPPREPCTSTATSSKPSHASNSPSPRQRSRSKGMLLR